jgi:thiol-disulfide isomerase/thioredoxin
MKKLLGLILLLIASPVFSQITVEGRVTDANGNAPILAHTHIGAYNGDMKKSISTPCSKDGHFSVIVPKAGIYSLRISAVNQQEISIPLFLDAKDKAIEMNIQLHANPFNKEPEKVTVIGDWNKFAFASTEQMTPSKTADGKTIYSYERTASGDTLSYQLMGIAEGGHSVNGSQADYFIYDGGGDYRSVIRTHKGDKVTITFDPSKLNYSENNSLPNVDIKNNAFLKKAYELTRAVDKMQQEAYVKPAGAGAPAMTAESYKALLAKMKQVYQDAVKSGDTKFSELAAVMLAKQYDPDFEFTEDNAEMVMKAVPASSPFWAMAPTEASAITNLGDKKLGETYKKHLKSNPEKSVRAIIYAGELERAVAAKDMEEWRILYTLLKNDYADVPEIKWTVIENNPDAVVQVGKLVPSFEVALLDGSGKVSNSSMLGKYYMIDFWATWCGPCVREMPAIHKAYEKFKGKKGFEIVSLSMDAAEAQIAPFRAKKWKMPWLHAFIPGIFEAELAKKFEVAGIPKPVLVGPDGKIIAMQEDLRGETLEKTLTKFLGESN